MKLAPKYLAALRHRAKTSHIYRSYQLTGLEIARILEDKKHKSLYIKLAKNGSASELLRLAKEVAERKSIRNKGAYFMSLLTKLRIDTKIRRI